MKNSRLTMLAAALALGGAMMTAAQAQYVGPSEHKSLTSVDQVLKNAKDDDQVALRGKLVRKVSDEKYIFADETGEVQVEIDDKIFPKVPVDENTPVEISGEMDKSLMGKSEIDVKAIAILK